MKNKVFLMICLAGMLLTGCSSVNTTSDDLITIECKNSGYVFDEKNKIIPFEGYELNQFHPYEAKETDKGLEVTFFLNKKIGDSN